MSTGLALFAVVLTILATNLQRWGNVSIGNPQDSFSDFKIAQDDVRSQSYIEITNLG